MSKLIPHGITLEVRLSSHEVRRLCNGDMIEIFDELWATAKTVRIVSEGKLLAMSGDLVDADGNVHDSNPSTRYQEYYHRDGVTPVMLAAFRAIAICIIDTLGLKQGMKVIDLGCSGGGLVRQFCDLGIECLGIDGSSGALDVTAGKIKQHDLRVKENPPWMPGSYDLAVCSDVAEHLEPEHAGTIAELCAGAVKPGGYLIFGAAVPGQGGLGHVHCAPHEYWIYLLSRFGVACDRELSEALRTDVRAQGVSRVLVVLAKLLRAQEVSVIKVGKNYRRNWPK